MCVDTPDNPDQITQSEFNGHFNTAKPVGLRGQYLAKYNINLCHL